MCVSLSYNSKVLLLLRETFTIERIEVVEGYVGAVAYKNL